MELVRVTDAGEESGIHSLARELARQAQALDRHLSGLARPVGRLDHDAPDKGPDYTEEQSRVWSKWLQNERRTRASASPGQ